MSIGASSDFKELVRSQTDIVGLIGETIALQPARGGREHKGLCPFHDDHDPSMIVSTERQSYKCWACGEGGDCFSFIMKIDGLDFREALVLLAQRAGLEIPRNVHRQGGSSEKTSDKPDLYAALDWAAKEFHQCLFHDPQAEEARQYLRDRGFKRSTIEKFQMGYHPDDWNWISNKARGKFSNELLFRARLLKEQNSGQGYYDDFKGRLMFPIRDMRSRVVAFGGRVLPSADGPGAPKYLNSSESEVFIKSQLLYGFDAARDGIRKSETAIVVEGYTDCIIPQQFGVNNVVGTLGTALGDSHVSLLKRLARRVVQCYDGDEAGQKAAERTLSMFLAQEVDLRILTLPDNQDPADFLEEQGFEAFQQLVEQAPEAWEHKLTVTTKRYGLESIDGRQRVLDEMLALLAVVPRLAGTAREDLILSRLAQRVLMPERQVRQRLRETRNQQSQRNNRNQNQQVNGQEAFLASNLPDSNNRQETNTKDDLIERELLEIVFAVPETIGTIQSEIAVDELRNNNLRNLLQFCFDLAEQGIAVSSSQVISALEDPELKRWAVMLDESWREKEVDRKVLESASPTEGKTEYAFLNCAIENLKWRRWSQTHERSKGQMAQLSGTSATLENDRDEKLRLLSEMQKFHEKRAASKN